MTTTIPLIIYGTDFAGRDKSIEEGYVIPGVRYILFTDRDSTEVPAPWEARPPQQLFRCPSLTSKWHKLHPHRVLPTHRLSLFMDASLRLLADPTVVLNSEFSGFAAHRHRHRNCLFAEAEFCRSIGVADPEELKSQLKDYASMITPQQRPTGLWETGVLIRNDNRQTRFINSLWWQHILRYSKRDQISLAYLNARYHSLFPQGMITDLPGTFDDSTYFKLTSHGGPLPVNHVEAWRRFPGYMQRREEWAENVKQLSQVPDDAVPPA